MKHEEWKKIWAGLERQMDTLRRENADLKARVEELECGVEKVFETGMAGIAHVGAANYRSREAEAERRLEESFKSVALVPTPGASDRLKEQAIKEEEEFQGFRISYAHGSPDALPEVVLLESVKDGTILKYEPSDRLKEQHYRECAEIAKKLETGEESYYHRKASVAILQKLEEK